MKRRWVGEAEETDLPVCDQGPCCPLMVSLFVYVLTSCQSKFCRSGIENQKEILLSLASYWVLGIRSIVVPSQRSWQQKCKGWVVKAGLCVVTCSVCVVYSSWRARLCCALGEEEREWGAGAWLEPAALFVWRSWSLCRGVAFTSVLLGSMEPVMAFIKITQLNFWATQKWFLLSWACTRSKTLVID